MTDFSQKYGPWALVAGGAQGIGEAWSRYIAERGVNVIALDREQTALDRIKRQLPEEFGVKCLPVRVDLSDDDMLEQVVDAVGNREVGLLVYNAAIADVGPFFKENTGLDFERARIAVNVTGPTVLTYHFAKPMLRRRAGGIVFMSSGAGMKGAAFYSAYSATKAHGINLAEALWYEFRPYNVDVLAVVAGMTLSTAARDFEHLDTSAFQTPEECVAEAMTVFGKEPCIISGEAHRAGHEQLAQLPNTVAVEAMAQNALNDFLGGTPPPQALD